MVTLTKSGNAVKFAFDDNPHYLNNGEIEVPVNSLSLVIDDSEMATFRKASSNDIFLSISYDELGMTKAELESFYKENMVGSTGGGGGGGITSGEVQSMIDESISGKADTSAVTSVDDALTAHTANTTVHVTAQDKSNWNAKSDFSGDYNDLTNKPTIPTVPTSNTAFTNDAGYITSAQSQSAITAAVSGKVDTSTFNTYSAQTQSALDDKADASDYYDKNYIDENYYTNDYIDGELIGKQDELEAGTGISIVNNVISVTGVTVDQTIIENSTNAVAGGAVYAAIGDIESLLSNI